MTRCLRLTRCLPLLLVAACNVGPTEHEEGTLPVTAAVVSRAPFQPTLELIGLVVPSASVEVRAQTAGIVSYPARFAAGFVTGAEVHAGEPLATLTSLERSRESSAAKVAAESAQEELTRMERGYSLGVLPQVEAARARAQYRLAEARLASARLEAAALVLRAPLSGHLVVSQPIAPGSELRQGDLLASIAGGGTPHVEAQAAASELTHLHPGLATRFRLAGGDSDLGHGSVRAIAPIVDANGTVTLVADVDDAGRMPPPGSGVEVEVALTPRPAAISLPEEAIVASNGGSAVFVLERSNGHLRARWRNVETGERGDGRIEIVAGLAPGDRVAVSGVAALINGVAVTALTPAPTATDPAAHR
jgi:RND family efflux transporter MFP subunit